MAENAEGEPPGRLARICDAMSCTQEQHPEYREGDKCVVFMGSETEGALMTTGYGDDGEALAEVLAHLTAIFKANGMTLEIFPIGRGRG